MNKKPKQIDQQVLDQMDIYLQRYLGTTITSVMANTSNIDREEVYARYIIIYVLVKCGISFNTLQKYFDRSYMYLRNTYDKCIDVMDKKEAGYLTIKECTMYMLEDNIINTFRNKRD